MRIDIVDFSGGGDSVSAVYKDGELYFSGDYYHDKIDDYISGFLLGIEGQGHDVYNHSLTDEAAEQFAEDGFDFPEQFPNQYEIKNVEIST